MTPIRETCPVCGRGPRDKTLVIFDNGNVHCHRCEDWQGIKDALSDRNPPAVNKCPPKRSTSPEPLRWSNRADWLWSRGLPIVGTPVERYLRLRECALPENDVRYLEGEGGPCMLARVTDTVTNKPLTLHFTAITLSGKKAPVERPKRLLGGHRKQGGVIRLWADEDVTQGLALAEGIETALTVARVHTPIWAAVDAGNLENFPVLPGIEAITIYADNDSRGQRAARDCARRWVTAGREVVIVTPTLSDWNDEAAA